MRFRGIEKNPRWRLSRTNDVILGIYLIVAPKSELQCVYREFENLLCLLSKLQGDWDYKHVKL